MGASLHPRRVMPLATLTPQPLPHLHDRLSQSILAPFTPVLQSICSAEAYTPDTICRRSLVNQELANLHLDVELWGERNAHLNKLSITSVEQHLRHLRAVFAFGEFVPVAFFDDAALV